MTEIIDLIKRTIALKEKAYSPYSHFRVAATVKMKSGKIYEGINIENAAYSPTLCAERSALAGAISAGEREIDTIIINGDSEYTYPCGVCRQFIREFADKDTKIIIAKDENSYKTYTIDELLPYSFSKEDLE